MEQLRPARETCEQCHWPQKFHGDKLLVRTKFAEDEANTRTTTVLVLKLGGRALGGGEGIHGRHLDEKSRVEYVATDGKRQVIPQVTYVDDRGERRALRVDASVQATPEQLAKGERRTMDCMDCHNRPTHTFELPERALDRAMAEGSISPELPFVKKKAIELLRAEYPDRETAGRGIREGLKEYYRTAQPQAYASHRALGRGRGGARGRDLRAERVPEHEGGLGHLPQPHRPRGLPGLLPLPRRQPQDTRRPHDHAGLQCLPLDPGDG